MFSNPEVRTSFKSFGYNIIYITGPDTSFKNGVVEHGHYTVPTSTISLLIGVALETKFWPYAFMHVL